MEPWAQELRSLIRDGGPDDHGHSMRLAKAAASNVADRRLGEILEASLVEALDMIALADELGYGAFARQHAISFVDKIASAAGASAGPDGMSVSSTMHPPGEEP